MQLPSRHYFLRGFTLVELSITLLIIALVAGGIVVGRELIEASQIRQQVSQVESMKTAFNAFKIKYDCLPGDCAKAVDFGLSPGSVNGDGNGKIRCSMNGHTGGWWNGSANQEQINAWFHLQRAGLIDGNFVGQPPYARPLQPDGYWPKGTIAGVYLYAFSIENCATNPGDVNLGPSILLAATMVHPTDTAQDGIMPILTPAQAYNIDIKLDDGKPNMGSVMAMYPYGSPRPTSGNTYLCSVNSGGEWKYATAANANTPEYCSLAIGRAW